MGLVEPLILLGYVMAVAAFFWLILRAVRALEQMGTAMQDLAVTLKRERM